MRHYQIWSEEEKELVRRDYTGTRTSVLALSQVTGHPVTSVKGIVYKLGLGLKTDHKPWTKKEEEALAELITKYPIVKIAEIMKRPVNSVASKSERLKLSRRIRDGYFTQREVAQIFGVDSHWVRNKISNNQLVAIPNHEPIPKHGGSYWRITEDSVRKYLIDHSVELTGRNVNLNLIVWLLTNNQKTPTSGRK